MSVSQIITGYTPREEGLTYFGGQPFWMSETPWPEHSGEALRFIGQIDLQSTDLNAPYVAYIFWTFAEPGSADHPDDDDDALGKAMLLTVQRKKDQPYGPSPQPGPSVLPKPQCPVLRSQDEPGWLTVGEMHRHADQPGWQNYAVIEQTYIQPKIGGAPINPEVDYAEELSEREWFSLLFLPEQGEYPGEDRDLPFQLGYGLGYYYIFLKRDLSAAMFEVYKH